MRKTEAMAAPAQTLTCPKCRAPMVRREGAYGSFYGCSKYPKCDMTQSLSSDEASDQATRDWRRQAHAAFDPLWQGITPKMSRTAAYGWLQRVMYLREPEAHISKFNINQCRRVIALVKLGVGL